MRVYNTPIERRPKLAANVGVYAQDQWALNRFTFNYGIRWKYLKEEIPVQERVAGRFAPAQRYEAVTCESMPGMTCWKSWAPRLGVAYDLFGNGRTALKMSYGKYMTPGRQHVREPLQSDRDLHRYAHLDRRPTATTSLRRSRSGPPTTRTSAGSDR